MSRTAKGDRAEVRSHVRGELCVGKEGFGIDPELCRGVAVNAIFGCCKLAALAAETIDWERLS
jgi:hypothetical protein